MAAISQRAMRKKAQFTSDGRDTLQNLQGRGTPALATTFRLHSDLSTVGRVLGQKLTRFYVGEMDQIYIRIIKNNNFKDTRAPR